MSIRSSGWLSASMVVLLSAVSHGQDAARPMVPQIVTSAQGEVRLAPDRATITIGVQSRASTAADAATQNSRKQRAVIDAIKARGIPAEQIGTSNFNVIPETRYDREGQAAPRTTSYLVMNTINVELKRIDQVGQVIDASLAAGANQINSLAFGISVADSARRAALTIAVGKAKADAEVMARAAGGSLGPLIELLAGDVYIPPPRPVMAMAKDMSQEAGVPIEAGQEVVRVTVNARWQFLISPR